MDLQAQEAYATGDHATALQLFDSVATTFSSVDLFYNMGNCHFKLGDGLRQWRLRHVQSLRCPAEMQLFRHGQKLPPQPKFNQGQISGAGQTIFFHMQNILIQPEKWIGKNQSKRGY